MEIKTALKERLRDTLSLLSKIRWINLNPRLVPTIDYHHTMTRNHYQNYTMAGNATLIYEFEDENEFFLEYLCIQIDTDATVINRQIRLTLKNVSGALVHRYLGTATPASSTFYAFLSKINSSHDNAAPGDYWNSDKWCIGQDRLDFDIVNGQAGDSIKIRSRLKVRPQTHVNVYKLG